MSTTDNKIIMATLKRGRVYYLRDREFLKGEPQEVTPEDEAWLRAHAIDEVTVENEGEHQKRQKFSFEYVDREEDEPKPTPSPRSRSR